MMCAAPVWFCYVIAVVVSLTMTTPSSADQFQIRTKTGVEEVEAKLLGSNQGATVLEQADGTLKIVAQANIADRTPTAGPEPITGKEMIAQLTERFGEETFRATWEEPYVIGLVLSAPLSRSEEGRVRSLLRRANGFMNNVEKVFERFAKSMSIDLAKPKFPLVLLIFETDSEFEEYTKEVTGQRGLSAGVIAGFYSHNSNWLAVRLSECQDFEVPLHEAIHQQVYNRGLFKRLAPVPSWFNEGIATGFEGEGDRVNSGPNRVNSTYARQVLTRNQELSWSDVVSDDRAFKGDVLAGEAYMHAWSLHWMLVRQHEDGYRKYVDLMGEKEPLQLVSESERQDDFQKCFGVSVAEVQQNFLPVLRGEIRRQRISLADKKRVGYSLTKDDLGEVELSAVNYNGVLQVGGRMRNASPIRDMDFYICVLTGTGMYAEWYLPGLRRGRTVPLQKQAVSKVLPGAPGGGSAGYRVIIKSTVPNTDEANQWSSGQVPRPSLAGP